MNHFECLGTPTNSNHILFALVVCLPSAPPTSSSVMAGNFKMPYSTARWQLGM